MPKFRVDVHVDVIADSQKQAVELVRKLGDIAALAGKDLTDRPVEVFIPEKPKVKHYGFGT